MSEKPLLTEQMPSSGDKHHEHVWQKVGDEDGCMVLVCSKEGCNATKKVPKPTQTESRQGKPLLMES